MIDTSVTKQVYVGDGVTTQFPIPFPFDNADDVKVSLYVIATEEETVLTSDYYVDTVAMKVLYPGYPPGEEPPESEQPPVLPDTEKLIVYRDTPVTQLEDLGEKYPLPIIEDMVDKATMILQEIDEKADRAIKVGKGDTETPEELKARLLASSEAAAASAAAAAQSEANAATSVVNASKWAEGTDAQVAPLGGTHSSKGWGDISKIWSEGTDAQAQALGGTHSAKGWADVSAGYADDSENSKIAAAGSADNASDSATLAQAWAESNSTPDGEFDADSPTGYTQSSKTWALSSKADAQYADEVATQLEGIEAPFAWDDTATYNYPDIVAYTDGYTYRCVGTNVTGTDVPGQSTQWVSLMYGIGAWQLDANQDLMPAAAMIGDDDWEYDAQGDLMPMAVL